jgi:hypothetical protein
MARARNQSRPKKRSLIADSMGRSRSVARPMRVRGARAGKDRRRQNASTAAVSASLDAINKVDAAISRWVIAAGLKLIAVPVDCTWMRRSLAGGSRTRASHASRARAGRSRQRQSKWAGSTRRCTRTALVTAPFLIAPSRPSARSHVVIFRSTARVPAAAKRAHGRTARAMDF